MKGKTLKVSAISDTKAPKDLNEALVAGKESGVVEVPVEALQLAVTSGCKIEVNHGK